MAGTAGLEPANAGIKTPCLNHLGYVPPGNVGIVEVRNHLVNYHIKSGPETCPKQTSFSGGFRDAPPANDKLE